MARSSGLGTLLLTRPVQHLDSPLGCIVLPKLIPTSVCWHLQTGYTFLQSIIQSIIHRATPPPHPPSRPPGSYLWLQTIYKCSGKNGKNAGRITARKREHKPRLPSWSMTSFAMQTHTHAITGSSHTPLVR